VSAVTMDTPTLSFDTPGGALLRDRVENFLAYEAELLDAREYDQWLDLLADDIHYWMPLARNFEHTKPQDEYSEARRGAAWFDESKPTLEQRVKQLQGGDHWAEEPASRTTHIVSNIRIISATSSEIQLKSRFILYVNRREEEVRLFVGKRFEMLRPVDDGFLLAKRHIFLDQSKLLFKNLTTFF
jgi:3-phenylpropionate/cinnamic acid dioxygenase small subunit